MSSTDTCTSKSAGKLFSDSSAETATIAKDADGIYTLTIESNGAVYTKANE